MDGRLARLAHVVTLGRNLRSWDESVRYLEFDECTIVPPEAHSNTIATDKRGSDERRRRTRWATRKDIRRDIRAGTATTMKRCIGYAGGGAVRTGLAFVAAVRKGLTDSVIL